MYSDEEKDAILLTTDLVGHPLTQREYDMFTQRLAEHNHSLQETLESLPQGTDAKARALFGQGMRLSIELDRLQQRGIRVLFSEYPMSANVLEMFDNQPPALFAIGADEILSAKKPRVYLTLAECGAGDYQGILISDRPFERLFRDSQVAHALENGDLALISNRYRSRAAVRVEGASRLEYAASPIHETGNQAKRVFVSGSRTQQEIPENVQSSLVSITRKGFTVVIGDSDKGVDKEIIDFLRVPLYPNVDMYTIGNHPRVNPEAAWRVHRVDAAAGLKPQQRQMVKDRKMASVADWGLAVFNPIEKNRYGNLQVSSGTLRNTIQMLMEYKPVKLFYRYGGEMLSRNLKLLSDLDDVLDAYRNEPLSQAERAVILSAKGVSNDDDPAYAKYQRIIKKYRALVRSEQKVSAQQSESASRPAQLVQQETLELFE